MKHEAGGVLGEVKQKQTEATKAVDLLRALRKLREARKQEAEVKGTQALKTFTYFFIEKKWNCSNTFTCKQGTKILWLDEFNNFYLINLSILFIYLLQSMVKKAKGLSAKEFKTPYKNRSPMN